MEKKILTSFSLRRLIELNGSIGIDKFMEYALSDPVTGYYITQDPIGKNGDFITSPEISQVFGELICLWCYSIWQKMGSPNKIQIIEIGPGRGTLMYDLLRTAQNLDFNKKLSITLIETSPVLQNTQKNKLSEFNNKISWYSHINEAPHMPTIIIANEFFDALPIQQFQKNKNDWEEIRISAKKELEILEFINIPLNTNESEELNFEYPNARDKDIVEISPQSINYVKDIASFIDINQGAALIIDYGYDYPSKNRIHFNSTLQGIKDHKYHPVLYDIGNVDITAHVDFASFNMAAATRGVNIFPIITQREFLLKMGIELRTKKLIENLTNQIDKTKLLSATERLINPLQMGNLFKVMALTSSNLSDIYPF